MWNVLETKKLNSYFSDIGSRFLHEDLVWHATMSLALISPQVSAQGPVRRESGGATSDPIV